MALQIYLVGGWNGGSGRSLTAALLAFGLHLKGRRSMLVRQIHSGLQPAFDPIGTTLPLPSRNLLLPDRHVLPADLSAETTAMVHESDDRFAQALRMLAAAEFGSEGDVIVDLCCHDRALNAATMLCASSIVVPARPSMPEIDWAARGAAHLLEIQRVHDMRVPTLVAAIGPDGSRTRRMHRLEALLTDYTADQTSPDNVRHCAILEAPLLDDLTLVKLTGQYEIWQEPDLQARCLGFATALLTQAEWLRARIPQLAPDL